MMLKLSRISTGKKVLLGIFCFVLAFWAAETFAQTATDSFTVGLQIGEDTEAPTVPSNLTATPIAETQIDLSWSASTDAYAVVGYQVFRDGSQIMTTADTTYSDTGLVASTTYSYTVRAFDGAGNVSSSSLAVATTTFATPAPPPVATTTPESGPQTGTVLSPELVDLQISAGAEAAEIEFLSSQPVRYVLRYGLEGALEDGILETAIYKRTHTAVLQDLEPNTRYYYELYVQDRFGREVVFQKASFETASLIGREALTNVDYFVGNAIGEDVVLRWQLPNDDRVAYVRILRNPRFFPQSPTDGEVVYEGSASNYTDTGVLAAYDAQYYSIFTYNLSGGHSSGRVLQVNRIPVVPEVSNPDTEDDATDVDTAVPPITSDTITTSAISIVQGGLTIQAENRQFVIVGNSPFRFRLEAAGAPQFTRSAMVTLFETENPETFFTYVLRKDADSQWYEAQLQGLRPDVEYSFIVRAYTMSGDILASYEGGIQVDGDTAVAATSETVWQVSLLYVLMGALLTLVLFATMRFFWMVLFGKRKRRHAQL